MTGIEEKGSPKPDVESQMVQELGERDKPSSATAQADHQKREDRVNEITDISTFHSTDKFDLERKNIQHYYVALSQYYKMRTQKNNYGRALGPGGPMPMGFGTLASSDQVDDHDLTITYIENGKLKRNFEKSKKEKEDNGELYEEILLFHGTDEENIDNIFNNNFDINHHPVRRSKIMAHGRGIYMSDRPGPCYNYGKMIILSRVLCNTSSGETLIVEQGNGSLYVIKNVANILPYCVINKNPSARATEMKVLTRVRSALAQLSYAQQQNVLANVSGGQAGQLYRPLIGHFIGNRAGPNLPGYPQGPGVYPPHGFGPGHSGPHHPPY